MVVVRDTHVPACKRPVEWSLGFSGWENQALFDFNDRPLPAMSEFKP